MANPHTGKTEVNLDMARDSIDTLLMLKEKTKGNLTGPEKSFIENSMQDLELNYIGVSKTENNKQPKDSEQKDEGKESSTDKEEPKEKT